MFFFGHLGIGQKLVSPWSGGLSRRAVLVGTILPDLIDKPLYYGLSLVTGKVGAELSVVDGTRTFGHTALLLLLVAFGAFLRRSKLLAALALGMVTHLLLDNFADRFARPPGDSALVAMLWPLRGPFVSIPFHNATEHLRATFTPFVIWAEVVGFVLLAWEYWKLHHEREIIEFTRERRQFLKRFRRKKKRS